MDKRKEINKYRFADPQRTYNICCELLEQGKQSGNDYDIAYAYLYMGDAVFAMGNADEKLKAIADRVCETVWEDGVICELKRMNII